MASTQVTTAPGATTTLQDETIDAFKQTLRGPLLRLGDAGYDEARRINNAVFDRHPALIVRCSGPADVIAAVNFAREHNLLLSVRGGGHNVASSAIAEGGVVIDLALLNSVRVDRLSNTVRAGGGATWGAVDRETQIFGLATTGGNVSTTGVGGLTLGGGLGHLRRKYGTGCENLVSVDIVTADGQLRVANATENADLFWGVRGGGGNFGVVTSLEFRLHPIGPMIAMVAPIYSFADAGTILRQWRDFTATAPDEISALALIWGMPPLPFVPAELHGQPVLILAAAYAGPADEGARALEPLRHFGTPLADLSSQMPYTVLQSAFDGFFPYGQLRYYWKSINLDTLGDEVIDAIVERAAGRLTPQSLIAIWHLEGAVHRSGSDQTAFAGRTAPYLFSLDTTWTDPADDERCIAWTRRFWSEMHAYSTGGLYLNFGGFGEEKEDLVRSAYGPSYGRLVELKNKYDPTNLFRMNQNIRPTM